MQINFNYPNHMSTRIEKLHQPEHRLSNCQLRNINLDFTLMYLSKNIFFVVFLFLALSNT